MPVFRLVFSGSSRVALWACRAAVPATPRLHRDRRSAHCRGGHGVVSTDGGRRAQSEEGLVIVRLCENHIRSASFCRVSFQNPSSPPRLPHRRLMTRYHPFEHPQFDKCISSLK